MRRCVWPVCEARRAWRAREPPRASPQNGPSPTKTYARDAPPRATREAAGLTAERKTAEPRNEPPEYCAALRAQRRGRDKKRERPERANAATDASPLGGPAPERGTHKKNVASRRASSLERVGLPRVRRRDPLAVLPRGSHRRRPDLGRERGVLGGVRARRVERRDRRALARRTSSTARRRRESRRRRRRLERLRRVARRELPRRRGARRGARRHLPGRRQQPLRRRPAGAARARVRVPRGRHRAGRNRRREAGGEGAAGRRCGDNDAGDDGRPVGAVGRRLPPRAAAAESESESESESEPAESLAESLAESFAAERYNIARGLFFFARSASPRDRSSDGSVRRRRVVLRGVELRRGVRDVHLRPGRVGAELLLRRGMRGARRLLRGLRRVLRARARGQDEDEGGARDEGTGFEPRRRVRGGVRRSKGQGRRLEAGGGRGCGRRGRRGSVAAEGGRARRRGGRGGGEGRGEGRGSGVSRRRRGSAEVVPRFAAGSRGFVSRVVVGGGRRRVRGGAGGGDGEEKPKPP